MTESTSACSPRTRFLVSVHVARCPCFASGLQCFEFVSDSVPYCVCFCCCCCCFICAFSFLCFCPFDLSSPFLSQLSLISSIKQVKTNVPDATGVPASATSQSCYVSACKFSWARSSVLSVCLIEVIHVKFASSVHPSLDANEGITNKGHYTENLTFLRRPLAPPVEGKGKKGLI